MDNEKVMSLTEYAAQNEDPMKLARGFIRQFAIDTAWQPKLSIDNILSQVSLVYANDHEFYHSQGMDTIDKFTNNLIKHKPEIIYQMGDGKYTPKSKQSNEPAQQPEVTPQPEPVVEEVVEPVPTNQTTDQLQSDQRIKDGRKVSLETLSSWITDKYHKAYTLTDIAQVVQTRLNEDNVLISKFGTNDPYEVILTQWDTKWFKDSILGNLDELYDKHPYIIKYVNDFMMKNKMTMQSLMELVPKEKRYIKKGDSFELVDETPSTYWACWAIAKLHKLNGESNELLSATDGFQSFVAHMEDNLETNMPAEVAQDYAIEQAYEENPGLLGTLGKVMALPATVRYTVNKEIRDGMASMLPEDARAQYLATYDERQRRKEMIRQQNKEMFQMQSPYAQSPFYRQPSYMGSPRMNNRGYANGMFDNANTLKIDPLNIGFFIAGWIIIFATVKLQSGMAGMKMFMLMVSALTIIAGGMSGLFQYKWSNICKIVGVVFLVITLILI